MNTEFIEMLKGFLVKMENIIEFVNKFTYEFICEFIYVFLFECLYALYF